MSGYVELVKRLREWKYGFGGQTAWEAADAIEALNGLAMEAEPVAGPDTRVGWVYYPGTPAVFTPFEAVAKTWEAEGHKVTPVGFYAHPQDAESLRGEVERLTAENDRRMCDLHIVGARAEKAEAERDAALTRVAELEAPKYRENSTHHAHRGPESLPCYCWTDADHAIGSEVRKQQAALTPQPEAGLEALVERFGAGLDPQGCSYDACVKDVLAAIAARRSRPVGEVKVKPLVWDQDGRDLRMDDTMVMGKGYDWDGYELLRQEGYGLECGYIIWPELIAGADWSLYCTADGLYMQGLKGEVAAKAAAQADYDARIRGAIA